MKLTRIIYAVTSAALSFFLLSQHFMLSPYLEGERRLSVLLLYWLVGCAVPLLFVFAYPRFLFANSAPQEGRGYGAVWHGLGAVTAIVLLSVLAVPLRGNLASDVGGSISVVVVLLSVLVLLLVVSVFLLLKNRSSLAFLAFLLFCPYWFLLALVNTAGYFQENPRGAVFYFLCFISAVFFAFAAGTISYRPTLAHAAALASLISAPWIYSNTKTELGLGNVWLVFNVPDSDPGVYQLRYAAMTIAIVGIITLAVVTAGIRLLPPQWRFRGIPFRERTWPAVAASLVVLAFWFSQSVLPYRIPGAVDYSDFPVFQILHVEKHGFQFREKCFSVHWQRPYRPISVWLTGSHRRLFQYRFQLDGSSLQLPNALMERLRALLELSAHQKGQQDIIKPIWEWNADRWYVSGQGYGLRVYGASSRSSAPQDVVDLFRELEKTPRNPETHSELKDVCLGFCYDALSAMGRIYWNHRCSHDQHGLVCR